MADFAVGLMIGLVIFGLILAITQAGDMIDWLIQLFKEKHGGSETLSDDRRDERNGD